jgi:hypothetical protein
LEGLSSGLGIELFSFHKAFVDYPDLAATEMKGEELRFWTLRKSPVEGLERGMRITGGEPHPDCLPEGSPKEGFQHVGAEFWVCHSGDSQV